MNGIGGRTVAEAQRSLTEREFAAWKAFYVLYPFDDLHRYHRPAAMVAAAWGGGYEQRIEFLSPTPAADEPGTPKQGKYSGADMAVINTMMRLSKGA